MRWDLRLGDRTHAAITIHEWPEKILYLQFNLRMHKHMFNLDHVGATQVRLELSWKLIWEALQSAVRSLQWKCWLHQLQIITPLKINMESKITQFKEKIIFQTFFFSGLHVNFPRCIMSYGVLFGSYKGKRCQAINKKHKLCHYVSVKPPYFLQNLLRVLLRNRNWTKATERLVGFAQLPVAPKKAKKPDMFWEPLWLNLVFFLVSDIF